MKMLNKLSLLILISGLSLLSCDTHNSPETIEGASAHWINAEKLIWDAGSRAETIEIRYSLDASVSMVDGKVSGGEIIRVGETVTLGDDLSDKYRHISHRAAYQVLADAEVVTEAVKGQIGAFAYDRSGTLVAATRVQFPGVIDEFFSYDGELGALYTGSGIQVRLWAPTAHNVKMHLYDNNKNLTETLTADLDSPAPGVWQFSGPRSWDKKYYRFEVTVYHHINNEINTFEVTDPYSVSLSTDSHFSQFADLSGDNTLKPRGWNRLRKELPQPTDITLYEAHVRDFSIVDYSVPERHRGTYMAFTHNGKSGRSLSDGMNHLRQLSEAGLTHLHLLPVNDIATVIENVDDRVDLHHPYERICEKIDDPALAEDCEAYGERPIREVFEQLAEEDPATDQIQNPYDAPGRYNGMAARDGFNWGYDPFHFNAPEGSYSTNPDGVTRIRELREMVMALHEIGLNIVVDVVYNHTFASGTSRFSVLDKVVPGYYHRYDADTGAIETSTCCDNTAAEHYMMEKLIIDSVLLWAKYYKIDSFRFDLMGHHPKYVMENLNDALAELALNEHGVDGKNIYIYGEGWNFGEVADNRIFEQATQFNMGGTGIGNFNDRSRDAIRGGNFTDWGRHQGFTSGQYLFPNEDANANESEQHSTLLGQADRIRVGMAGNLSSYPYINRDGELVDGLHEWIGFAHQPQESVNYIDKHDNETLWDNTQTKLPRDTPMDERIRVHMLSNAFINYGQGVPFYQMGTDILRSKSLDRNSFDSGDWYNAIDFSLMTHKFGTGLPPGWDNRNRWDDMRPFLRDTTLQVRKEHMELAHRLFREQLMIRYSSPLFRLSTADEIHGRVGFHNTGPNQIPGIIAMSVSDGTCAGPAMDSNFDGILVLFNAHNEEQTFNPGIEGLVLHAVHETSADEVVHTIMQNENGIIIPALTAVVFVKPQQGEQGDFPCNPALQ